MSNSPKFSARASALLVSLTLLAVAAPFARAEEPQPPLSAPPPLKLTLPLIAPTSAPETHAVHKIEWDPKWKKFTVVDGIATGVLGAWAVAVDHVIPTTTPRWTGKNPVDTGAANLLRAPTASGQSLANGLTNGGVIALVALPFLDAGLAVGAGDKNLPVALQLVARDAETLSTVLALTNTAKDVAARARPCAGDPKCGSSAADQNKSFWSGHTAVAFWAAGTVCSQHLNMRLYHKLLDGDDKATGGFQVGDFLDKGICVAAATVATGVGVGRIVGNDHNLSDVAVGAVVGTATSVVLPQILVFGFGGKSSDKKQKDLVMEVGTEVTDTYKGLKVVGRF